MARKLYPYAPASQHGSVRAFTRSNWGQLGEYGNAHAEQILGEKAQARAQHKRYDGHKMTYSRGDLRKAFIASRNAATNGPKVYKEQQRKRRLGTPTSASKVKKHLTNLHAVKFGHDPFHK